MYGTIRGIPVPRVDSCSGYIINPLQAEVAVMVCSCPEYLSGTSKKEVKKASICKKCKGSRLPLAPIGGTVRVTRSSPGLMASQMMMMQSGAATVRLPSSYSVSHKARPSIFNMQSDPYDLMRRTRLMSPELQPVGKSKEMLKSRGKSTSPSKKGQAGNKTNNGKRSPSPNENSINKCNRSRSVIRNASRVVETSNHKDCWVDPDTDTEKGSNGTRRSILSCDVNPYELVSNDSDTNDTFKPLSDDIFDAELLMHSKRYEDLLEPLYHLQKSTSKVINNVAAIAGQRIRLFTESTQKAHKQNEKSADYEPVEYLNQAILGEMNDDATISVDSVSNSNKEIKIVRSISPKRPPRRKIEVVINKEAESSKTEDTSEDPSSNIEEQADVPSSSTTKIELVALELATPIKSILKRTSQYMITETSETSEESPSNDISCSDEQQSVAITTVTNVNPSPTANNTTPRKKVQFLVEDQIINDNTNDDELVDEVEALSQSTVATAIEETNDKDDKCITATTVDPPKGDNNMNTSSTNVHNKKDLLDNGNALQPRVAVN